MGGGVQWQDLVGVATNFGFCKMSSALSASQEAPCCESVSDNVTENTIGKKWKYVVTVPQMLCCDPVISAKEQDLSRTEDVIKCHPSTEQVWLVYW
jgi:hypothetical protein